MKCIFVHTIHCTDNNDQFYAINALPQKKLKKMSNIKCTINYIIIILCNYNNKV